MNRKKSFARQIIFFLFFLFAVPATALEVGAVAPDFLLKTPEGRDVRLSQYRGRTILLKLATTWCPSCKRANDEISRVSHFLSDHDVVVVEVFLQDSKPMVQGYIRGREYGRLEHVALMDDGRVAQAYDVYLIPRLLFLDKAMLVRRDTALMSGREMIRQVRAMKGRIPADSKGSN